MKAIYITALGLVVALGLGLQANKTVTTKPFNPNYYLCDNVNTNNICKKD